MNNLIKLLISFVFISFIFACSEPMETLHKEPDMKPWTSKTDGDSTKNILIMGDSRAYMLYSKNLKWNSVNAGQPGFDTVEMNEWVLDNIQSDLGYKNFTDLVLFIGPNDVGNGRSTSDYIINLTKAIDYMLNYNPTLKIHIINNPSETTSMDPTTDKKIIFNNYNVALISFCKNNNYELFDFASLLNGSDGFLNPSVTPDGIHFYDQAYAPVYTWINNF